MHLKCKCTNINIHDHCTYQLPQESVWLWLTFTLTCKLQIFYCWVESKECWSSSSLKSTTPIDNDFGNILLHCHHMAIPSITCPQILLLPISFLLIIKRQLSWCHYSFHIHLHPRALIYHYVSWMDVCTELVSNN